MYYWYIGNIIILIFMSRDFCNWEVFVLELFDIGKNITFRFLY